MKTFEEHLQETARRIAHPTTDDRVGFVINMDTLIETVVIEHDEMSITVEMDQDHLAMLEQCGHTFDKGTEFAIYNEAEYQGKKVKLNDPIRTSENPNKKFKVYVKDPKTGNVKKVNFGHGGSSVKGKAMSIKKNNPKRRKSFRARHNCDNPGPRTKARYWSCRKW